MRSSRFLCSVASLLLTTASLTAEQPTAYLVIVNASNPVAEMSRNQLSSLFLKKATSWPGGRVSFPVDLTEDSTARVAFSREIHRKSVSAIESYWQQRIFSGRDVPPPELVSENEVIVYVKTHAGAVGYVSRDPADSAVKILKIAP